MRPPEPHKHTHADDAKRPKPTNTHTQTHTNRLKHTNTHKHTQTHTMRTARQEQSKEKRLQKLLSNCRAVLDVFRFVGECAMCSTGQPRQFVPCTLTCPHLSAALPTTSINPWRLKHKHTHTHTHTHARTHTQPQTNTQTHTNTHLTDTRRTFGTGNVFCCDSVACETRDPFKDFASLSSTYAVWQCASSPAGVAGAACAAVGVVCWATDMPFSQPSIS